MTPHHGLQTFKVMINQACQQLPSQLHLTCAVYFAIDVMKPDRFLRVLLRPLLHCCSSPGAIQHNAHSTTTSALFSGTVPAQQYKELLAHMQRIIKQEASKQRQGNSNAFQRTPAFIHAVVQAALVEVSNSGGIEAGSSGGSSASGISLPPPKGGFTDVGQHTGSSPRATSWPLLQTAMQVRRIAQPVTGPL